ncbi:MAG: hypothetical protein M9907_15290 [Burkholderiaceae bacterium]|nr:hypothetical protein [Burkholderiaceae bacterium]
MANIHFVKDGKRENGERLTEGVEVGIEWAVENLKQFVVKYGKTPPTFNPRTVPSDFSAYQRVVLEIARDEECPAFPSAGFYVIDLTPSKCRTLVANGT